MKLQAGEVLPPAFVMGFWRSGTTLLHNLLYAGHNCATPLTWQCNDPATFAIQAAPKKNVSASRPMDDGIVHLLGPCEDEFALLLLGEPSIYRGFFDPMRLGSCLDECLADGAEILPRWIEFVTALSSSGKPLLLKSPNHVFRIEAIARMWPEAATVWICRPFAEVIASNLRMWSMMIDLHRLLPGQVDLPSVIERLAAGYRDIVLKLLSAPQGPALWLNYADLAAAPEALSREAATFLGLEPRERPLDMQVDTRVHPRRTAQAATLPPRLDALARDIDDLHSSAMRKWGCRL